MISESLPSDGNHDPQKVRRLGLIFKTHLDLGYTDLAENVFRRYMDAFMPKAVQMVLERRQENEPFCWTTGSWLVEKYLAHAKGRARRDFEQVLGEGRIRWHALPFTFETESLTEPLLVSALRISARLDARFGVRTLAAKMTDVPGHCRGLIPALAAAGVRMLHIGINPACAAPEVPPVFRWRHPDGSEIIVCQVNSYGGYSGVPGKARVFAVAMTGDNAGPPTPKTLGEIYARVRSDFPKARVECSSLDQMAADMWAGRKHLPVVTAEIGDTWIHGYGTDPWKMAAVRRLSALREVWIAEGALNCESQAGRAFDENLLLACEHTWGRTWVDHAGQPVTAGKPSFERKAFQRMRRSATFQAMEQSWEEQRQYVHRAVAGLSTERLRSEARKSLEALLPDRPIRCAPAAGERILAGNSLALGPSGGARIIRRSGALRLSGELSGILGSLSYQVFGISEYKRYLRQYLIGPDGDAFWAPLAWGKPGLEACLPKGKSWGFVPDHVFADSTGDALRVCGGFPTEAVKVFGAPGKVEIFIERLGENEYSWDLRWSGKAASHIPEALWFSFRPKLSADAQWSLLKTGGKVDPRDVVSHGGRSLHLVQEGVEARDGNSLWSFQSPDTGLVAPGKRSLLNHHNQLPDCSRDGIHFNLLNNVWGTNFPMWYGDDARFRFQVRIGRTNRS